MKMCRYEKTNVFKKILFFGYIYMVIYIYDDDIYI